MEDLDTNPLYKAFMTKFKREFEIACRMSYIIAIPHSDSLEDIAIDQFLANSHILMPSKLLKMHYTPLQIGHSDDIEFDGRQLVVHFRKKSKGQSQATQQQDQQQLFVTILAEQIGYNINQKEYRTLLIDRPLLAPKYRSSNNINNSRRLLQGILAPRRSLASRRPNPNSLIDHQDCSKYLESISNETLMDLEADVGRLKSNYLMLAEYLDDAAARILNLVEVYTVKFTNIAMAIDERLASSGQFLSDSIKRAIRLSIENCAVHLLHDKLMTAIRGRHKKDDRRLHEKFDKICEAQLSVCQLGAQSAFAEFSLNDEILRELRLLSSLQSPLALVSCLMCAVGLISEALNQCVRFRLMMGIGDRVLICSDDLIASFVFALARARPVHLYSVSKYLEAFSWNSSARDQPAYYVATFQIVVQYVLDYTSDQEPQAPTLRTGGSARDAASEPGSTMVADATDVDDDGGDGDAHDSRRRLGVLSSWRRAKSRTRSLPRGFVDSLDSRSSTTTEPDSSLSSLAAPTDSQMDGPAVACDMA